jgi:(p)ppGpp synthase/HD superfamily hydrolase
VIKQRIIEAYNLAQKAHDGQKRLYSDNDYFVHPKAVARIIEDLTQDEDLIILALLHDTLEDTALPLKEITDSFGEKVASLVMELTTDDRMKNVLGKTDYLIKAISGMSEDAQLVKLADRYQNISSFDTDLVNKQHRKFLEKYFKETCIIMQGASFISDGNSKWGRQIALLISMIFCKLQYLRIKFGLEYPSDKA